MPYKEREIEKVYFAIGEVADMLHLNASVLRYWEKEFSFLRPKKNNKGDRLYTKDDIEKIKLIHHLLRDCGYTIDGARAQLQIKYSQQEKKWKAIEKLNALRSFLVALRDSL